MNTKFIILLLSLSFFSLNVFAQSLQISPAPSSGNINLDSQQASIYFSNTSTSASVPMSLSLVPSPGFKIGIDRCSGRTLAPKTSCYIVINVNDTLLSAGLNSASLNNNSNLLVSFSRTKIQNSGSSIFASSTSLSMNDFSARTVIISNKTNITRSYSPVLGGTDPSKYELSLNRCQNVQPGKSCTFSVQLKPQRAGAYSASISVSGIASSISLSSSITLVTNGVIPEPVESMSVSSLSLNFGTLTKFGLSSSKTITLTNTGNQPLTPVITPSMNAVITVNRCAQLLAGQSCALAVSLNPVYQSSVNGSFTGEVALRPSPSGALQTVSLSSTLNVPPASLAYLGQGGTCSASQHFENNVCVNNPVGHTSCQDIKDETPSSSSGYYDLSNGIDVFNVYCDMSHPTDAYMEIWDLNREPMLTSAQVVQRINQWSNFGITESNILRDGAGSVAWTQDNTNLSLVFGQSISFDRLISTKFKFTAYLGSGGAQGQLVLHSSNQNNCHPDTTLVGGCYQNAYQYQGVKRFIVGDFGTSQAQIYLYDNGNESAGAPYTLTDYVVDNTPSFISLTQAGRYEGGSYHQSPYMYFSKLLIKGAALNESLLPKLSCAEAKNSGVTASGYLNLDPDGVLGTIPPSRVYCDMTGAGEATITETCNYARIFGQKNSSNNLGSGVYSIDFDGAGAGAAMNQYCDMNPTAWNNNEGGYTLVGIFRPAYSSPLSIVSNISDISTPNLYLADATYQSVLSKSSHIILRSNRENSNEVVYKVNKGILTNLNCARNNMTLYPNPSWYGNNPNNLSQQGGYWFWAEYNCDVNNGDYSMVGLNADSYVMFSLYTGTGHYIQYYNWGTNSFVLNGGDQSNQNGTYRLSPRDPSESLYIFVK